jgi:hypothetical protein
MRLGVEELEVIPKTGMKVEERHRLADLKDDIHQVGRIDGDLLRRWINKSRPATGVLPLQEMMVFGKVERGGVDQDMLVPAAEPGFCCQHLPAPGESFGPAGR